MQLCSRGLRDGSTPGDPTRSPGEGLGQNTESCSICAKFVLQISLFVYNLSITLISQFRSLMKIIISEEKRKNT